MNPLKSAIVISLLTGVLSFWSCGICIGQNLKFHHLQNKDLLDNQSILSIAQDKEGRLWFGGKEKLYVYDSRSIKNIFENDSTFTAGEYLNKIAIDEHNNIFLGTAYSLLIYNVSSQKYIVSKNQSLINRQVNDIKVSKGKTFVASSEGLYLITFDSKQKKYRIEKRITDQNTQTVTLVDENTILYAIGKQIYRQSGDQEPQLEISLPLPHDFITTIYTQEGETWIGTHSNGIFVYHNNQYLKQINENTSTLLSNNIRKITKANNTIFVGTLKGLTTISLNGHMTNFTHETNIPWSLSQNSIYDIYQDNQNIVWIGTYFGGINAIYPNPFPIRTLTGELTSTYRLRSDIVSSIVEDKDRLYVGTEESGLQIIDKASGKTQNIPTPSNLVKALLLQDNKLYIGQHNGGLSILDLRTYNIRNGILPGHSNSRANNINTLTADPSGHIFLGTDNGIFQWDGQNAALLKETNSLIGQICDNGVDGLFTLWRGDLLFKKYTEQKFEPLHIKGLKEPIRYLSTDTNGDLWLSTDHHIYVLNGTDAVLIYENSLFKFGRTLHLNNTLWICSDNGLLRYSISTKKLHVLTVEDGLTTNFLQDSRFYVNDDDHIYLTSLKGLNTFNPQTLKFNNQAPMVLFSKFSVFDKEVLLEQQERDTDIPYHIDLSYDQNYFTIEFASSNFIKPQKNKYKYKLEGFDKDWKRSPYPVARYMNIAPGKYTLWMMVSNNDDVWNEVPMGIAINIAPPLWRTWWAYVLYILIAAAILHFMIKFIVERQLLINSDKEHEKKIKFFTQISHEIRTPLTLITVPIEDIIHSTQDMPVIQAKAKRLKNNADKLLGIVNELLEFKKIDDGKEVLILRPVQIKTYLEDFFYLFSDLAVTKHLHFYIKQIEDIGSILLDTKQFDKALFNLLSNAVKYSHDGGTVFLEARTEDGYYTIRIADNGIGISDKNQFKIFEEYYRDPKAQDTIGTGIGLALTKKVVEQHKGEISCTAQLIEEQEFTVFTIRIPVKYFSNQISIPYDGNEEDYTDPVLAMNKLDKETLLLVEDNHELSETIANLFMDHYHVLKAYDGEEGLLMASKYLPDIIVSDVMMPKMNGIDMCEKIKSNILTTHIPLILLTADTNETSHISGLKYGANVYLQKPFNTSVLLLTVKNLLELASNKRKEFNIRDLSVQSDIDQNFLRSLEKIIDRNLLNNEFNVEFISKEIGMSPPILYKKLKAVTGLSVNNFIKQYRLKKAVTLLNTNKNISEVAYAVGFSDRKYFSREFKKLFGVNPSEYPINPH